MHFVDGFLFDDEGTNVLLIRKVRPQWQAGLLNGIGGKIEDGERPIEAMCREFQEETGVTFDQWEYTIRHDGPDWTVFYYRAHSTEAVSAVLSQVTYPTDEMPELCSVMSLEQCVRNIKWAIPLSNDRNGLVFPILIRDDSPV
ncbi:MAG: NUDIX domain-containing protein [Armatimonadota bacterium]